MGGTVVLTGAAGAPSGRAQPAGARRRGFECSCGWLGEPGVAVLRRGQAGAPCCANWRAPPSLPPPACPPGRAKDTIVLSSGENVEPQPIGAKRGRVPSCMHRGRQGRRRHRGNASRACTAGSGQAAGGPRLPSNPPPLPLPPLLSRSQRTPCAAAPTSSLRVGGAHRREAGHGAGRGAARGWQPAPAAVGAPIFPALPAHLPAPPPPLTVLTGSGHRALGALIVPDSEALEEAAKQRGKPGACLPLACLHIHTQPLPAACPLTGLPPVLATGQRPYKHMPSLHRPPPPPPPSFRPRGSAGS